MVVFAQDPSMLRPTTWTMNITTWQTRIDEQQAVSIYKWQKDLIAKITKSYVSAVAQLVGDTSLWGRCAFHLGNMLSKMEWRESYLILLKKNQGMELLGH